MSAKVIDSVGIVEGGSATGTIFRVGKKFGMTAAHVIDSITNPHNATGHDDLSQLSHCSVRFDEQGQMFRLKPVLNFKDKRLDVAIVEFLDDDTFRLPQSLQLVKYDVSTSLKGAVIIGHGHPQQPGKFLEAGVNVIQQHEIPKEEIIEFISNRKDEFRTSLKIMGNSADIVETGYSGCESDTNMLLNCFMGPGASGSPVFSTEFQESLKVTGIFICGYPKMYYDFPESMRKTFPLKYTFEAATKTSAIYKALCKQSKKLANSIFL